MKEYLKPEVDVFLFSTEDVTTIIEGDQGTSGDDTYVPDDF